MLFENLPIIRFESTDVKTSRNHIQQNGNYIYIYICVNTALRLLKDNRKFNKPFFFGIFNGLPIAPR